MPPNLAIDTDTVRMLAQRARAAASPGDATDLDGEVHEVEFNSDTLSESHTHSELVEEEAPDSYAEELTELIEDLNIDEAAELVAIVWVGRGDFESADWPEAVTQAHARRTGPTAAYLARMPMLADYIESGLDSLGL